MKNLKFHASFQLGLLSLVLALAAPAYTEEKGIAPRKGNNCGQFVIKKMATIGIASLSNAIEFLKPLYQAIDIQPDKVEQTLRLFCQQQIDIIEKDKTKDLLEKNEKIQEFNNKLEKCDPDLLTQYHSYLAEKHIITYEQFRSILRTAAGRNIVEQRFTADWDAERQVQAFFDGLFSKIKGIPQTNFYRDRSDSTGQVYLTEALNELSQQWKSLTIREMFIWQKIFGQDQNHPLDISDLANELIKLTDEDKENLLQNVRKYKPQLDGEKFNTFMAIDVKKNPTYAPVIKELQNIHQQKLALLNQPIFKESFLGINDLFSEKYKTQRETFTNNYVYRLIIEQGINKWPAVNYTANRGQNEFDNFKGFLTWNLGPKIAPSKAPKSNFGNLKVASNGNTCFYGKQGLRETTNNFWDFFKIENQGFSAPKVSQDTASKIHQVIPTYTNIELKGITNLVPPISETTKTIMDESATTVDFVHWDKNDRRTKIRFFIGEEVLNLFGQEQAGSTTDNLITKLANILSFIPEEILSGLPRIFNIELTAKEDQLIQKFEEILKNPKASRNQLKLSSPLINALKSGLPLLNINIKELTTLGDKADSDNFSANLLNRNVFLVKDIDSFDAQLLYGILYAFSVRQAYQEKFFPKSGSSSSSQNKLADQMPMAKDLMVAIIKGGPLNISALADDPVTYRIYEAIPGKDPGKFTAICNDPQRNVEIEFKVKGDSNNISEDERQAFIKNILRPLLEVLSAADPGLIKKVTINPTAITNSGKYTLNVKTTVGNSNFDEATGAFEISQDKLNINLWAGQDTLISILNKIINKRVALETDQEVGSTASGEDEGIDEKEINIFSQLDLETFIKDTDYSISEFRRRDSSDEAKQKFLAVLTMFAEKYKREEFNLSNIHWSYPQQFFIRQYQDKKNKKQYIDIQTIFTDGTILPLTIIFNPQDSITPEQLRTFIETLSHFPKDVIALIRTIAPNDRDNRNKYDRYSEYKAIYHYNQENNKLLGSFKITDERNRNNMSFNDTKDVIHYFYAFALRFILTKTDLKVVPGSNSGGLPPMLDFLQWIEYFEKNTPHSTQPTDFEGEAESTTAAIKLMAFFKDEFQVESTKTFGNKYSNISHIIYNAKQDPTSSEYQDQGRFPSDGYKVIIPYIVAPDQAPRNPHQATLTFTRGNRISKNKEQNKTVNVSAEQEENAIFSQTLNDADNECLITLANKLLAVPETRTKITELNVVDIEIILNPSGTHNNPHATVKDISPDLSKKEFKLTIMLDKIIGLATISTYINDDTREINRALAETIFNNKQAREQ